MDHCTVLLILLNIGFNKVIGILDNFLFFQFYSNLSMETLLIFSLRQLMWTFYNLCGKWNINLDLQRRLEVVRMKSLLHIQVIIGLGISFFLFVKCLYHIAFIIFMYIILNFYLRTSKLFFRPIKEIFQNWLG